MGAAAAGGQKSKKKKWSKGRSREQANHKVLLESEGEWASIQKDLSSMKVITAATMIERFGVNGSLARSLMKKAAAEGIIKSVESADCKSLPLYTRATLALDEEETEE